MTSDDVHKLALNILCTNYMVPRQMELELARAYLKVERQLEIAKGVLEDIVAVDHYGTAGEIARRAIDEIAEFEAPEVGNE